MLRSTFSSSHFAPDFPNGSKMQRNKARDTPACMVCLCCAPSCARGVGAYFTVAEVQERFCCGRFFATLVVSCKRRLNLLPLYVFHMNMLFNDTAIIEDIRSSTQVAGREPTPPLHNVRLEKSSRRQLNNVGHN